jgi:hypothetical protein
MILQEQTIGSYCETTYSYDLEEPYDNLVSSKTELCYSSFNAIIVLLVVAILIIGMPVYISKLFK